MIDATEKKSLGRTVEDKPWISSRWTRQLSILSFSLAVHRLPPAIRLINSWHIQSKSSRSWKKWKEPKRTGMVDIWIIEKKNREQMNISGKDLVMKELKIWKDKSHVFRVPNNQWHIGYNWHKIRGSENKIKFIQEEDSLHENLSRKLSWHIKCTYWYSSLESIVITMDPGLDSSIMLSRTGGLYLRRVEIHERPCH
jgi:hypothetical protein